MRDPLPEPRAVPVSLRRRPVHERLATAAAKLHGVQLARRSVSWPLAHATIAVEIAARELAAAAEPVTLRDLLRAARRAGVRRVLVNRGRAGWLTREYWTDQHQMVRVIALTATGRTLTVIVRRPGTHIEFTGAPTLPEFVGALAAIGWDTGRTR